MRIGPYEVDRELGRGGMGVVHAGRSPAGEPVAIKVLLRATRKEAVARFDRERRLQGALGEAAGFVPVLDVGDSPAGPWLAMPLVSGGTLRARLRQGVLAIDEALAIGRALAASLGRAHALGVVHRDLKPENVLFAADGRPLVADLGLAKHFASDAPGASRSVSLSRTGEMAGTAGYMAPEQMNDAKSVGPPADVFALGAILYECLAGKPAFEADSVHGVFARVAQGDHEPLRRLRPDAPRWLAAVVERALASEPGARFADGAALAAALEKAPIPAGRRRLLAAAGALGISGGVAALVVPRGAPAPVVPAVAPPTSRSTPAVPPVAPVRSLTIAGHGDAILGLALSPRADLIASACADRRVRLFATRDGSLVRTLKGHNGEVMGVAFSPRGDQLASGSHDCMLLLWDAASGKMLRTCLGAENWTVAVAFSSDFAASASNDGSVRLYRARPGSDMGGDFTGDRTLRAPSGKPVNAIAFSPDGRLLASAHEDASVRVWSVLDEREARAFAGHAGGALAVAFSPRGDLVASGGRDGRVRLWSLKDGNEVGDLPGHAGEVRALAFTADGRLVSGGADGTVRLWSREGPLASEARHAGRVNAVVAGPGFVASAGDDRVIRLEHGRD